ncbi:MAG: DUF3078 domain-containing protein [Bacteroidetes bacterium]|uniref:DUF3078 domain-containing protein n=1 Tax=Candidatus Cryptobacteroides merdavium TaxID=2840769 RepID=A0A9D9H8J3_9BACT|nr:DUF3078 domain-containing protein [Candidatus Cryptobacteroides merdavium]
MKKELLTILLSFAILPVCAQDLLTEVQKAAAEAAVAIDKAPVPEKPKDPPKKYWKNSLQTKLDFGQTSLTNWAAGGYNTVSLKTFIDANANYSKNEMFWNNRLQLDYGFLYSADKPVLQKTDDRIYLESKWGYQATNKLYYSAEFSFKSQFSNTYDFPTPTSRADGSALGENEEYGAADWKAARVLKSGFLSPAYTNLALGLDYKPLNWLTINFAPLTGGFVIVDDPLLRGSYSQPLKKEFENATEVTGDMYKAAKFEFGAQLKMDFKVNVNDNFAFSSQVVLFSDYLDKPQNLRVNWDNRIDWKLARFFSFTVTTGLIYDDDVMIQTPEESADGIPGHQRVQFKESLSFGFVYTFASRNS